MNTITIDGNSYTVPEEKLQEVLDILAPLVPSYKQLIEELHSKHQRYPIGGAIEVFSMRNYSQIHALVKLMNTANHLNNKFNVIPNNTCRVYSIRFNQETKKLQIASPFRLVAGEVYFRDRYRAMRAIQILGEDTIKQALGIWQKPTLE